MHIDRRHGTDPRYPTGFSFGAWSGKYSATMCPSESSTNSRTKRPRWGGNQSQTISKGFGRNLKAVACSANGSEWVLQPMMSRIQTLSAKDAEYGFERLWALESVRAGETVKSAGKTDSE